MHLVEITSKQTVLENTRKAATDAANLALAPLQAQMSKLENEMHRIVLRATEEISGLNGQLAMLEEFKKELLPKDAPPVLETEATKEA